MKNCKYLYVLLAICLFGGFGKGVFAQEYPIEKVSVINMGDGRLLFRQAETDSLIQGPHRIIDGYHSEYLETTFKDGLYDGKYEEYKNKQKVMDGFYKMGEKEGLFRYYQYNYPDRKQWVERELTFKDGKLDGIVRTYYEEGKLESEKGYQAGLEHGIDRRYDRETGECIQDFNFANGKPEGVQKRQVKVYGSRGRDTEYLEESFYANGLQEGVFSRHYMDGSPCELGQYRGGKATGRWLKFSETGDTLSIKNYADGMLNGESVTFADGNVREKIYHYRNDKKDGLCTDMSLQYGVPYKQVMYKDGKQHGEEKCFVISAHGDETEYLMVTTTYVNDRKDGPYREEYMAVFTEKGKKKLKSKANGLKEKGQYKNNHPTGHWVKYDSKGKVEREWDN